MTQMMPLAEKLRRHAAEHLSWDTVAARTLAAMKAKSPARNLAAV
jgi:hypothetical protein